VQQGIRAATRVPIRTATELGRSSKNARRRSRQAVTTRPVVRLTRTECLRTCTRARAAAACEAVQWNKKEGKPLLNPVRARTGEAGPEKREPCRARKEAQSFNPPRDIRPAEFNPRSRNRQEQTYGHGETASSRQPQQRAAHASHDRHSDSIVRRGHHETDPRGLRGHTSRAHGSDRSSRFAVPVLGRSGRGCRLAQPPATPSVLHRRRA
jgi:hypothetical protein